MAFIVGEVFRIVSLLPSRAHTRDFGGNVCGAFVDTLIELALVTAWPACVGDGVSCSSERMLSSGHDTSILGWDSKVVMD